MLKTLIKNPEYIQTMRSPRLDVLRTIGNTPLVKIDNVYAKLEGTNPSGSIKDRVAFEIIASAERNGELKEGYTIVEATSGNTGISLAMCAAIKGYKMIAVMPENMSGERVQIIKAFGAELVLTSQNGSLKEARETAEQIARGPRMFFARQFSNPSNIKAQEKTGFEILVEIGAADAVVAGIGTGGTLVGISNILKKANHHLKSIAVEPEEAAVMFGGSNIKIREHQIQGIGDGFIPDLINMNDIDEVITISSEAAIAMARRLHKDYGLPVGISSGANIAVALEIAKRKDMKTVVTVLPDRAERYLSMGVF